MTSLHDEHGDGRALDPHGICNPGKLGLADPFGGQVWAEGE